MRADAPLLVFLPGSAGLPARTTDFANVAARQGYRVIGLEYNDIPAVAQRCPKDRDPDCSEKFRRKRIYGDNVTAMIDDRAEESIVRRLTALLATLWFAVYHEKERTASLIARAYAALGIPANHVRMLTLQPAGTSNPPQYHPSVVGNGVTPRKQDNSPAYADDWRFMLGDVHGDVHGDLHGAAKQP